MTTFIATSRGARMFPGRCEEFHRHSDAGPDACEMVSLTGGLVGQDCAQRDKDEEVNGLRASPSPTYAVFCTRLIS